MTVSTTSRNAADFYKEVGAEAFPHIMCDGKAYKLSPAFKLRGYSNENHPRIPPKIENYVFELSPFFDTVAWLMQPDKTALWLSGPTGCGKTSLIEQVCARLNWPVASITCSSRTEFRDFVGGFQLTTPKGETQPRMKFVHGVLPLAMRMGWVLLINEVDMVDPGELVGLNDILEGKPLQILENQGEVIMPHPCFRLVVTANSNGAGDASGVYSGVRTQNVAAMDRYRMIECKYPSPKAEEQMLTLSGTPDELAHRMVQFANDVRQAAFTASLSVPLSTRVLMHWAKSSRMYSEIFQSASKSASDEFRQPLKKALQIHWLSKLSPEEQRAANEIAFGVFGDLWMPTKSRRR